MFIIIGIMISGVIIGYLLRNYKMAWIHKGIMLLIWVLLFLLGAEVGGNDAIISGLFTIGMEALAITIGAVVGSIAAAWALWSLISTRGGKKYDL
ncbi:MAG: LysO family transporter [Bacteroidales bacterium]